MKMPELPSEILQEVTEHSVLQDIERSDYHGHHHSQAVKTTYTKQNSSL